MNLEGQILFFFSALGVFNGLILSLYFAFFFKNKSRSTYFLAALVFVISIRVMKSVFLAFYPDISSFFIQIGLTSAFLIGPFLYLYTQAILKEDGSNETKWFIHIIPIILCMIPIGILYPYNTHWHLWQHKSGGIFGWTLFVQWLLYTLFTVYKIRLPLSKLFSKTEKPSLLDYWLINIVTGCFLIWLAYNTNKFTSYIVGAFSFSFIMYISLMIWFFRKKANNLSFLSSSAKYGSKSINEKEALSISSKLDTLLLEEKIHLRSNLKLTDLASKLQIKPHILSQYMNDNLGQSFSNYINTHRVDAASKMLESNNILTIEGIGSECGFKSNTSFYEAFKKVKGMTPAQFKKALK